MAVLISVTGMKLPDRVNPAALGRRVQAGLLNVLREYNGAMQVNQTIPADTGALRASIPPTIEASATEGRIGTPLVYGLVMEVGRRPGQRRPPVEAILPWVHRKLRPRPKRAGRSARLKGKARREAHERGVAYVVARKIGERGIRVPLAADGRGAMFRRTLRQFVGRAAAVFVRGFEVTR